MAAVSSLVAFVRGHRRLFVLTGAGCSTASGIPAYRDETGAWTSRAPMRYAEFVGSEAARRRYWSRSMVGWPRVATAEPNAAHRALAALEKDGRVASLVTQNVDGLHQKAGSRGVIDLHGRLDEVECLACGAVVSRQDVQRLLQGWNGAPCAPEAPAAPDGDAPVERDLASFRVPHCPSCGGPLKPRVVFFGENIPRPRAEAARQALGRADAVLVVGSSLAVWSGYRFCVEARERGLPVAALNRGATRADGLLALKVEADCGEGLTACL